MKRNYYKVQVYVPSQLVVEFRQWLRSHVDHMLDLPCFYQAELFEQSGSPHIFQCLYYYESPQDFQDYLDRYAEKMRGELSDDLKSQLKFQRFLGLEELL